jgi:hypothetical protein
MGNKMKQKNLMGNKMKQKNLIGNKMKLFLLVKKNETKKSYW